MANHDTDWREQALSAARDAWHGAVVDIPEAVVDAVAPIIRADERERMTLPEWTQVVADARASAVADERERLREQVKAKRRTERQWVTNDPDDYSSTLSKGAVGAFDAVLALLGGDDE